jgi:hypothetical protein
VNARRLDSEYGTKLYSIPGEIFQRRSSFKREERPVPAVAPIDHCGVRLFTSNEDAFQSVMSDTTGGTSSPMMNSDSRRLYRPERLNFHSSVVRFALTFPE